MKKIILLIFSLCIFSAVSATTLTQTSAQNIFISSNGTVHMIEDGDGHTLLIPIPVLRKAKTNSNMASFAKKAHSTPTRAQKISAKLAQSIINRIRQFNTDTKPVDNEIFEKTTSNCKKGACKLTTYKVLNPKDSEIKPFMDKETIDALVHKGSMKRMTTK